MDPVWKTKLSQAGFDHIITCWLISVCMWRVTRIYLWSVKGLTHPVLLYLIKTDNQSIISIEAINQLSEREIAECLLDWPTSLVVCCHPKNHLECPVCPLCSGWTRVGVFARLCRCRVLVNSDTSFRYRFYRHVPTCSGPAHIKTYGLCLSIWRKQWPGSCFLGLKGHSDPSCTQTVGTMTIPWIPPLFYRLAL